MLRRQKRDEFITEWQAMARDTPQAVRELVDRVVERHAADLARRFYTVLLQDEEARSFLNYDLVEQRLHASMQNWLNELFDPGKQDAAAIYDHQHRIGTVHARIQVPIALVMRGARILKHGITDYLIDSPLDRGELVKATNFVAEAMELALDAMTDSYVVDLEKHARNDEAYRMFALGQNMVAERERQRAALLEWSQGVLRALLDGEEVLPDIRHSAFGMWLQHKAAIVFDRAPELERIRQNVERLDIRLIEGGAQRKDAQRLKMLMQDIDDAVSEIKYLINELFDRFIEVESGRDALTRLLNRRYLPAVLTREMNIARRGGAPFALLLLDIDHFKHINDDYGHNAGDLVLQQVADLVTSNVRAGDFVFRFGGEELLVVLVEIDREQALRVAEHLRERIAAEPMRLGDGRSTQITVSIGVAAYRGHPDYETVIKDADGALYEAKGKGRNCCVLSRR